MRRDGLVCIEGDDEKVEEGLDGALTYLRDGNPILWVFPSPGRIWKERWVAFTNDDSFVYFKGSRDEVLEWAQRYITSKATEVA